MALIVQAGPYRKGQFSLGIATRRPDRARKNIGRYVSKNGFEIGSEHLIEILITKREAKTKSTGYRKKISERSV